MLRFIFFLFSILTTCLTANTQNLPSLENVAEAFFKKYHTAGDLAFEKRPDGYYVGLREYGQPLSMREKFFDVDESKFLTLGNFYTYYKDTLFFSETTWQIIEPKPRASQQARVYVQELGQYEAGAFTRQPFYGYSRWYIDVISYYEKKDVLTENELNALARAYYRAGSSLLTNTSSHYIDPETFDLPFGQNALTNEQLSAYLYYHNKCLATYEALIKLNPNYSTPVGPVTTKYANEVMDGFVTLLYYQNEKAAKTRLKPDIYDDYMLMSARNLLKSCPDNALLFTYGDSDTYPLYYIQAVDGFRTDVIIINLSLIVLPRYRSMLLAGPLGAKPLISGLPDFYYEEEYILWKNNSLENDEVLNLSELYPLLDNQQNYYGIGAPLFLSTPGGGIDIDIPSGTTFFNSSPTDYFRFNIPKTQRFLFPTEVFQLDLLQSNGWKRPICFSLTVQASNLKFWKNNIVLEGLTYQIYPDSLAEGHGLFIPEQGVVNTTFNTDYWKNLMEFDTNTIITDLDKSPFHQISLLAAFKQANALSEENKNKEVIEHIKNVMTNFPNKIKPWDGNWVLFIKLLDKIEGITLAALIAETILTNYEQGIIEPELNWYYPNLETIRDFGERHGLSSIEKRCIDLIQ